MNKKMLLTRQYAEARGNMYRFLSTVYLNPPKQDSVQYLSNEDFLRKVSFLFGRTSVAEFKKFAVTAQPDKDFSSIKQEYMDLFAVPTGRYVTPFEDVYRGKTTDDKQEKGPLLGERAIVVRRMYRQAGADMHQSCKELPTHIGVELSFMHFLCKREAEAIRDEEKNTWLEKEKRKTVNSNRYRELQMTFLQEHLNTWFPQLSQSIRAKAKSCFYRGLALLTEEFLSRDTANLKAYAQSNKRILPNNISMGLKEG